MRTRCGPLTAFAATLAVEMSASSVRGVIHRVAETLIPLPETRFGASATADDAANADRLKQTATSAHRRDRTDMNTLPFGTPAALQPLPARNLPHRRKELRRRRKRGTSNPALVVRRPDERHPQTRESVMSEKKRIAVPGATGRLGRHIVELAEQAG